jgi:hypothetical protein
MVLIAAKKTGKVPNPWPAWAGLSGEPATRWSIGEGVLTSDVQEGERAD